MKVLVVDDSALMRRLLTALLGEEPDIEVVTARTGAEALELLPRVDPDVVTLDVTMPGMDGLACLRRIMVEHPKPVVMVSALTQEGTEETLEALRLGAVDVLHKPGIGSTAVGGIRDALVEKVRAAAGARLRRARNLRERLAATRARITGEAAGTLFGTSPADGTAHAALPAPGPVPGPAPAGFGVLLIGVSTGGPGTLEEILPLLPAGFPWPVVVAQHMPPTFTGTLARRLDSVCPLTVVEAAQPVPLTPGAICIARGGADLVLATRGGQLMAIPVPAAADRPWHPSVDRLVESALQQVEPARLTGVLLTGMGRDGAEAMAELRRRGGRTIAESQDSAVVWGMPGELVRLGGADAVLPAEQIAAHLRRWIGGGSVRA